MSDENETNNPYQPPTLSDETLPKKDADGPKAKLHPVHWLVPIFGYAYVPVILIFRSLANLIIPQRQYGIAGTLIDVGTSLAVLIIIATLIYVLTLIRLERRRNEQGTNTRLSSSIVTCLGFSHYCWSLATFLLIATCP